MNELNNAFCFAVVCRHVCFAQLPDPQLLGGMLFLFFGMVVLSWPLCRRFLHAYRSLCKGQAALVVASTAAV